MCEEEGVGFIDLWGYFVGKEHIYLRDGLHRSGRAQLYSLRTCFDLWTVKKCHICKLDSQARFTEKPNTGGTDKDINNSSAKNYQESST